MSFQIVLSSASIPLPLSTRGKLRKAQEKGFDGLEILLTRRALNELKGKRIKKGIYSLHQPFREGKGDLLDKISFFDLKPFPEPWSYRDYFRLSSQLEIPIVIHINDGHFKYLDPNLKDLKKADSTLEFNTYQVDYQQDFSFNYFLEIAEKYNSKICFDVGYAIQNGWNIEDAFLKLKNKIKIIHFYDLKSDNPKNTFDKNLTPGEGILPLGNFLQTVNESDWNGQITLELLPEPFSNHKKAAEYVRKYLN